MGRPVSLLSPRQLEIARLVARGLSNKAIADELGLVEGTVKVQMTRIFRELGVPNRFSLIVLMKADGASKSPTQ